MVCLDYIDDRLSFDYKVEQLIRKAAKKNQMFKNTSVIESKLAIIIAFITSNLKYCCILRHLCNGRMSKSVEKLQTRAFYFVYLDFENDYDSLLGRTKKES